MPEFTYRGDDRYYPDLGVDAVDGTTAYLDEAPDDRWTSSDAPAEPDSTPETAPTPEGQE